MPRAKHKKAKHPAAHPKDRKIHEFYTNEQLVNEEREKKRKEHEKAELEIFEHLKQHTKRVLRGHR